MTSNFGRHHETNQQLTFRIPTGGDTTVSLGEITIADGHSHPQTISTSTTSSSSSSPFPSSSAQSDASEVNPHWDHDLPSEIPLLSDQLAGKASSQRRHQQYRDANTNLNQPVKQENKNNPSLFDQVILGDSNNDEESYGNQEYSSELARLMNQPIWLFVFQFVLMCGVIYIFFTKFNAIHQHIRPARLE